MRIGCGNDGDADIGFEFGDMRDSKLAAGDKHALRAGRIEKCAFDMLVDRVEREVLNLIDLTSHSAYRADLETRRAPVLQRSSGFDRRDTASRSQPF